MITHKKYNCVMDYKITTKYKNLTSNTIIIK